MDASRFDRLTRVISIVLTRRALTGALGLATIGLPDSVAAKKKRKKKKVTFNDFGCVDVGKFCKNGGQCCSGICQGKKGKKKCKTHDTGGCQADQDVCLSDVNFPCTTTIGDEGQCFRTTGNASFCAAFGEGDCFPCNKDADRQPFCGLGAACAVCESGCEEEGGTACLGLGICDVPDD